MFSTLLAAKCVEDDDPPTATVETFDSGGHRKYFGCVALILSPRLSLRSYRSTLATQVLVAGDNSFVACFAELRTCHQPHRLSLSVSFILLSSNSQTHPLLPREIPCLLRPCVLLLPGNIHTAAIPIERTFPVIRGPVPRITFRSTIYAA